MFNARSFRLDDHVAIVTGAGAGIGRSIARTFAGAGARVVVSDVDVDAAREVVELIETSGGTALAAACEVTEPDDLERLVQLSVDRFDTLTTVVGNAGGGGPQPFDMDMADFHHAFDLNVFSLFASHNLLPP